MSNESTALPTMQGVSPGALLAMGLMMKPGQTVGQFVSQQNGVFPTAIYNKPRSHPDVEAVKGKLVYAQRQDSDPINELRAEKDELANTVIAMKAQLDALMGAALTTETAEDTAAMKAELEAVKAELKQHKDDERMKKVRAARGKTKADKGITSA